MGTKHSVLCTSQQNFLPAYGDDVMSDCAKAKSVGFFGFRGPSAKRKSLYGETDKMHDSATGTSVTKEMAKSATIESTDLRKKKFGFRAPVRSASTVCSGSGERPAVKANNGTSLLCSKGKSSPFRPPGMESWKMIDDDNASGRSRSPSREKTLKDETPKKNNAPMTSSLPVNLNNSRLPGLMNRLTRSHTISARVSANDDSKECEVPPAEAALVPDQNNAVAKSAPSFLKRPKEFLFSGLSQRKSGAQRRETSKPETTGAVSAVHTPEQAHSGFQASPKVDKASEAGKHVGDHEIVSCETETEQEKSENSSKLENSPTLKKSEDTLMAKKDGEADLDESRKSSQLEIKQSAMILSRKDSGKQSSLDRSHSMTAKSSASRGHQTSISDAPLASLDFDDECSICSDDLMLDADVTLDTEESTLYGSRQSSISETVKRRLSNPRLSSAIPFLSEIAVGSEQKFERHSSLIRRQRSGLEHGPGQASDRRLQSRLSTASIDSKLLPGSDNCALNELMSLMEVSKVLPKSENSSDSKTFPGSGDGTVGQVRRQVSMKPPRQSSLIEDDEIVVIDGFAYRSMLQELTSTKTMLFRLKRMLQEDELGQPSFNHSVFKSNSDHTFVLQSDDLKIQNRDSELSLAQLQEENSALLSIVRLLQQTVDDQKKTIVLFQQQMTKYECGMTETMPKAADK